MKKWSNENNFNVESCTMNNFYWDIAITFDDQRFSKSARIGIIFEIHPKRF